MDFAPSKKCTVCGFAIGFHAMSVRVFFHGACPARSEIRLKLREQSRRMDEVALVKMCVGEVPGAVCGRETDEALAVRRAGEELLHFSRRESEPILQRATLQMLLASVDNIALGR